MSKDVNVSGKRPRRSLADEFKRDAVNLIAVEGYSFNWAAMAVGVSEALQRRFREQADQRPAWKQEWARLEENQTGFGKTVPTIRASLKYAVRIDESVKQLPRKMPRRRWHEDHAEEVAALKAKGLGTGDLVDHFGKSDTTIRKALVYAARKRGDQPEFPQQSE